MSNLRPPSRSLSLLSLLHVSSFIDFHHSYQIVMAPLRQAIVAAVALFSLSAFAGATATTDVELDSTRSNTGPLTTVFTPDPTCLSKIETRIFRPGGYPELEVGCEGPGGNECCPPRWGVKRYFSPGVCPSGYQACALPSTRQREETTRLCCPEYVLPVTPPRYTDTTRTMANAAKID
jgi:hypothetical protein